MKKLSRNRIILLFIFLSLPLICFILFLYWLFDPCHTTRVLPSMYQVCISAPYSDGCTSCRGGNNFSYNWNASSSCVENYIAMYKYNKKPRPSPIQVDSDLCIKCEDLYVQLYSKEGGSKMDYSFFIEKCTDPETVLPTL